MLGLLEVLLVGDYEIPTGLYSRNLKELIAFP
jgi:hypothetical protein